MSEFIREVEDSHPELFFEARSGVQRYDPLRRRKQQIIEEWSSMPVNDRNETIKRMLETYNTPEYNEMKDN
jgi:hypothetical protein